MRRIASTGQVEGKWGVVNIGKLVDEKNGRQGIVREIIRKCLMKHR